MANELRTFRGDVQKSALSMLVDMVGEDRAREAAGRVAVAFDAARRTAKDPTALERCKPASVGACIALSALTQLYPGGPSPDVYLVPRGGELGWTVTHVGLAKMAARQGYSLRAVPVHVEDHIVIEYGEAVEHRSDATRAVTSLADMVGVVVVLRRISDGAVLTRAYVPRDTIEVRRKAKGAGPVWNQWPVEMAMKTAIKYAFARGMVPLSGEDWSATMSAEVDFDRGPVVDVTPTAGALAGLASTHQIEETPDDAADSIPEREREAIDADYTDAEFSAEDMGEES